MEIVTLRVYRGPLNYDATGKVKSENQLVKVARPSVEWNLLLKHGPIMYTKAEVVEVNEEIITHGERTFAGKIVPIQTHSYKKVDTSDEINAEILALYNKPKVKTPQEQIDELNAKLEALTKGSETKKEVAEKPVVTEGDVSDDLESLRAKYYLLFGEKPSHLMKPKSLKAAIEQKENESK